jgi:two-component system, cell cycle response regulator DivK
MDRTILVVEDDIITLRYLSIALEKRGVTVITALSGYESIDIAKREHPALILMDIVLPDIPGYEVAKLLHEEEALQHIPIVAMSINDDVSTFQAVRNAGCETFLIKPITPAELDKLLSRFLPVIIA